MNEPMFKNDAKSIVDVAFETKLFKDSVTRDDMNTFEELIQFMLSSRFDSYIKCQKILEHTEKHKANKLWKQTNLKRQKNYQMK